MYFFLEGNRTFNFVNFNGCMNLRKVICNVTFTYFSIENSRFLVFQKPSGPIELVSIIRGKTILTKILGQNWNLLAYLLICRH